MLCVLVPSWQFSKYSLLSQPLFLTVCLIHIIALPHHYFMTRKNFIPAILMIVFFIPAFVLIQPVKKIHGYKQASIPGIIPSFEGNERLKQAERKQQYNYWFYMEFAKTESIKPDGLWIGGLPYEIKFEEVNVLPVKKIINTGADKNDTILMVPRTSNKVMLLYPGGLAKDTTIKSKYVANLAFANELVISYKHNNKRYYKVLKKLKELAPEARP